MPSAKARDEAPAPIAIGRLIASGRLKDAVAQAKTYHGESPSAQSETLLVDAYFARIDAFGPEMAREAMALVELVEARYPSAKARLPDVRAKLEARFGLFDELLAPLAASDPSPETIHRIEAAIGSEVSDLPALARCARLPADHPLRVAASSAWEAFCAVTRGRVEDEALTLPEISRRSPLAPWKHLIRAIACYYVRDDEGCEKFARAIDPASAPARIVAALRALLRSNVADQKANDAGPLVSQVGGDSTALRQALHGLDQALAEGKQRKCLKAIRETIRQCEKTRPELVAELRQHIFARSFVTNIPIENVKAALGGPSLHNASQWRLIALALEPEDTILACAFWDEFRRHAIHEKWFSEGGLGEAALYLRMTELLLRMDRDTRKRLAESFARDFVGCERFYEDQPESVRAAASLTTPPDAYFVELEELFERAARCDPHPETFRSWLSWAREEPGWKAAEKAALSWHHARPQDTTPLLELMQACEKRNALKKALGFLEKAEQVDRVNPEVRRARLRLTTATAVRHFEQRKLGLAMKDIEQLDGLPQTRSGDRRALVPAFQWVSSSIKEDGCAADFHDRTVFLLDSKLAASVVLLGVARACRLPDDKVAALENEPPRNKAESLVKAVARAVALGEDTGIHMKYPARWEKGLLSELESAGPGLDAPELGTLATTALLCKQLEIAYVASGLGLSRGEPHTARFLLLRARSLPVVQDERFVGCLRAAVELARRQRDMALVAEVVETGRLEARARYVSYWDAMFDNEGQEMSREETEAVIHLEIKERDYPDATWAPSDLGTCDSPGKPVDEAQYQLFDDDSEDFDEDMEAALLDTFETLPKIDAPPSEMLEMFLELLRKEAPPGSPVPTREELLKHDPETVATLEETLQEYFDGPEPEKGPKRKRRKRRNG